MPVRHPGPSRQRQIRKRNVSICKLVYATNKPHSHPQPRACRIYLKDIRVPPPPLLFFLFLRRRLLLHLACARLCRPVIPRHPLTLTPTPTTLSGPHPHPHQRPQPPPLLNISFSFHHLSIHQHLNSLLLYLPASQFFASSPPLVVVAVVVVLFLFILRYHPSPTSFHTRQPIPFP